MRVAASGPHAHPTPVRVPSSPDHVPTGRLSVRGLRVGLAAAARGSASSQPRSRSTELAAVTASGGPEEHRRCPDDAGGVAAHTRHHERQEQPPPQWQDAARAPPRATAVAVGLARPADLRHFGHGRRRALASSLTTAPNTAAGSAPRTAALYLAHASSYSRDGCSPPWTASAISFAYTSRISMFDGVLAQRHDRSPSGQNDRHDDAPPGWCVVDALA